MDRPRTARTAPMSRALLAGSALALLAACGGPLDLDMRGRMGGPLDTSDAALNAVAPRPDPDDRGVISYPNYQVAVARRGDSVADVASRVGLPAEDLARFNGVRPGDPLRAGEIVALPRRVAEPSPATGSPTTGPIRPVAEVDVTTLASNALDRAPATATATPAPQSNAAPAARSPGSARADGGVEPVRHRVERGETAFTIARLYNVTPRALADWNGLDSSFTLREGQFLLIPVARSDAAAPEQSAAARAAPVQTAAATRAPEVSAPGRGSPTPTPPSASTPLPAETPKPAAQPPAEAAKPAPEIGEPTRNAASDARMTMPAQGSIIREYSAKNAGIDIAVPAGTAVKAADAGTVAAITKNTDNISILVIKHDAGLLTVYTHINAISVAKGDRVSRGQSIAKVAPGDPARIHFEVRDGFDSVDPMSYLR